MKAKNARAGQAASAPKKSTKATASQGEKPPRNVAGNLFSALALGSAIASGGALVVPQQAKAQGGAGYWTCEPPPRELYCFYTYYDTSGIKKNHDFTIQPGDEYLMSFGDAPEGWGITGAGMDPNPHGDIIYKNNRYWFKAALDAPPTTGEYPYKVRIQSDGGQTVKQENAGTIRVTVRIFPTLSGSNISGSYNQPASITLGGNAAVTSYRIGTAPTNGTASISGDQLTYTPNPDYIGADQLTVIATGDAGDTAPATFNVTVAPPAAPTLAGGSATTGYNAPASLTLAASGAVASYAISTQPAHGTAVINGTDLTYTPDAGYIGPDQFSVTATGAGGTSSPATYNVTVSAPAAPTLDALSFGTGYETAKALTLAASGIVTSYAVSAQPAHGTATVSGATVTYTPADGYFGADQFSVTATGPGGTSAPAIYSATVATPGAPSTPDGSINTGFETPDSVTLSSVGVVTTYALSAAPAHGEVSISGTNLTYTPDAGYYGADEFSITATGPGGTSAPARYVVAVGLPSAPLLSGGALAPAYQSPDTATLAATGVVTSYAIDGAPAHGTASITGTTLTYTPSAGYIGSDQLTVIATGPGGASAPATYSVTVAAPAAPVLGTINLGTAFDTAKSVALAASGYVASYAIDGAPAHGTASITGTTLTYTPSAGYIGSDQLTVIATGPGGASAPATVDVTVSSPGAPVLADGAIATGFGAAGSANLVATGIVSSYTVQTAPTNGTVSLVGPLATYTPNPDFSGNDQFTVIASGPGGASAPATISVTVAAAPPPPPPPPPQEGVKIENLTLQTKMGKPVSATIAVSGKYTALMLDEQPEKGVARLSGTTVTYTPPDNWTGTEQFSVMAKGASQDVAAAVTVVVEPDALEPAPPVAPTAEDFQASVHGGEGIAVSVTDGATGGPFTAVEIVDSVIGGVATVEGLKVIFRADDNATGKAVIKYRLRNSDGFSAPASITVELLGPKAVVIDQTITVLAGKSATVDLTRDAVGGPFSEATIVGLTPASSGNAEIRRDGDRLLLTFVPTLTEGQAVLTFNLKNAAGVSNDGKITVTVAARANPVLGSREVFAIASAQAAAAVRAPSVQMSNVTRRMEALHSGQVAARSFQVGLPRNDNRWPVNDPGQEWARMHLVNSTAPQARPLRSLGDTHSSAKASKSAVGVWSSGAIEFGKDDLFDFTTTGLSAGIDALVSPSLSIGAGAGYSRDVSDVGDGGSRSEAAIVNAFGYASYHPSNGTFVDVVGGVGRMQFDSRRHVAETDTMVTGARGGGQAFGAITAGYELRTDRLLFAPYGRVEFSRSTLNAFSETGDDTYALRFAKQTVTDVLAVAGLRSSYRLDFDYGALTPSVRMEYRKSVKSSGVQNVSFADWADSPIYAVNISGNRSEDLVVGLGAEIVTVGGWTGFVEGETTASAQGGQVSRVRAGGGWKF